MTHLLLRGPKMDLPSISDKAIRREPRTWSVSSPMTRRISGAKTPPERDRRGERARRSRRRRIRIAGTSLAPRIFGGARSSVRRAASSAGVRWSTGKSRCSRPRFSRSRNRPPSSRSLMRLATSTGISRRVSGWAAFADPAREPFSSLEVCRVGIEFDARWRRTSSGGPVQAPTLDLPSGRPVHLDRELQVPLRTDSQRSGSGSRQLRSWLSARR
jgi:hypothetical protein